MRFCSTLHDGRKSSKINWVLPLFVQLWSKNIDFLIAFLALSLSVISVQIIRNILLYYTSFFASFQDPFSKSIPHSGYLLISFNYSLFTFGLSRINFISVFPVFLILQVSKSPFPSLFRIVGIC